ncbi:MAG: hypothetical protein HOE90_24410 [Bacteriovoracaceae bacterium]|nr:hypothetical protein [Bacteriovoracaceae bacterium]
MVNDYTELSGFYDDNLELHRKIFAQSSGKKLDKLNDLLKNKIETTAEKIEEILGEIGENIFRKYRKMIRKMNLKKKNKNICNQFVI